MYYKLNLLIASCSFVFFSAFSQNRETEDVIYLSDSSIIRGEIVELTKEKVKIKIIGGTVLAYSMDEVEKIKQEPREILSSHINSKRPLQFKNKGIFNITQAGLLLGQDASWDNFHASASLQMIMGYQFFPRLQIGAGAGIDDYRRATVSPVFLYIGGDLDQKHVAPYYYAEGGYGFAWDRNNSWRGVDDATGGIMAGAGIGLKVFTTSEARWLFTLGYRFQKNKIIEEWWDGSIVRETWHHNRINFKVGISL